MVHSLRDLTSDEINALYATSGNLLLELPQHSEV